VEALLEVGVRCVVVDLTMVVLDLLGDLIIAVSRAGTLKEAFFVPLVPVSGNGVKTWRGLCPSSWNLNGEFTPVKYQRIHDKGLVW
jgi:hypothetical protein